MGSKKGSAGVGTGVAGVGSASGPRGDYPFDDAVEVSEMRSDDVVLKVKVVSEENDDDAEKPNVAAVDPGGICSGEELTSDKVKNISGSSRDSTMGAPLDSSFGDDSDFSGIFSDMILTSFSGMNMFSLNAMLLSV